MENDQLHDGFIKVLQWKLSNLMLILLRIFNRK
eukprot:UN22373